MKEVKEEKDMEHQNGRKALYDTAVELASLVQYQTDAIVSKTLISKKEGVVTVFAFDAGQKLSKHTAPFDALVYAVAGSALFTVGGRPQTLSAGECFIMPTGMPHEVNATEKFKMMLVMIKTTE